MWNKYKTNMGGSVERFQTTCWSEISDARTLDEARQKCIVNELIKKYWKPVYCYLRRKGYGNESAKDLTQGFFQEIVLGRDLFEKADINKGRFRTFILIALERYTADIYDKETAQKRSPKGQLASLETSDIANSLEAQSELTPEQFFHYTWASEILSQVLEKVENQCCAAKMKTHWNVFLAKVINPIINGTDAPALKDICAINGIENEAKASNMIFTVKSKFRSTMNLHLRQFVNSDSEVEDEFKEVFNVLSQNYSR
jgi:hypothetical protein